MSEVKDSPCLSGFAAYKPAESGPCQRHGLFDPSNPAQAGLEPRALSPTGGRAGRFGAAVRGGPWTGLLSGHWTFLALRVARSVMEN